MMDILRDLGVEFHPMGFVENLKYMGLGMLGIFVVMGVIIASIMLLGYLSNKKGKK